MTDLIERDYLIEKFEDTGQPALSEIGKGYDLGIKAALRVVKKAPAVNRWIPVEDALPEENVRCLVYTEGGGYGISRRMGRNLEKWNCLGLQVTHWMPMPEPPEREAQDEAQP